MLHPDTLPFLRELRENNHKEWFDANRDRYQAVRKVLIENVQQVISGVAAVDETVRFNEASKNIFRINRDVRFSANKSPYKTNMGTYFSEGGKNSSLAGYYLHLEPGGSFVAGGCYQPEPPMLKQLREHIDYDFAALRKLAAEPDFAAYFGEIQGEKLVSAPKGYAKDHPAADLLRHKSWTVSHPLTDEEAQSPDMAENVVKGFTLMHPFIVFLNEGLR